jgi:hypothetical protein
MSHMEIYTYFDDAWVYVSTVNGDTLLPSYLVGDVNGKRDWGILRDYLGPGAKVSDILSVERKRGWGARYSANGYLDATDYVGPHPTEEAAIAACKALYGDDSEPEPEPYDEDEAMTELADD